MGYGGARKGAGRRSHYGAPTKPIRVPEKLIPDVQKFIENKAYKLPLFSSKVAAGLPAPADENIADNLDLNECLVKRPASTFLVKVSGHSMINAGIQEGDLLIVDQSIPPTPQRIVVAAVDGELTVKRLIKQKDGKLALAPENPDFKVIEVNEENHVHIWGVVVSVIHSFV